MRTDGMLATITPLVNDVKVNAPCPKSTVGAPPVGLKLFPEIVNVCFEVFATALSITGTVCAQIGALSTPKINTSPTAGISPILQNPLCIVTHPSWMEKRGCDKAIRGSSKYRAFTDGVSN